MRRLAALALVALLSALPATAQTTPAADTIAAWRYAPLGIGDEWVYRGGTVVRIEGDTLISGVRYVREVSRTQGGQWAPSVRTVAFLRFDTAAAVVVAAPGTSPGYLRDLRQTLHWQRFDAPIGESDRQYCQPQRCGVFAQELDWTVYSFDGVSQVRSGPYRVRVKQVIFRMDVTGLARYAADIGLLYYDDGSMDMPRTHQLDYARVGGKTYGVRPLWVDASAAAQSAAQEVRAFPQPFAGRLQIEAPHIERGEAVLADLLGRRVARAPVEAGRAEIDGSGLAPGVYALRVCADGGGVCTVRAVVRR